MSYTYKDLGDTISSVNAELDKNGIDWMFQAGQRNGYTALGGGRPKEMRRGRKQSCHAVGTPAKCADEMFIIAFWKLAARLKEMKSNG